MKRRKKKSQQQQKTLVSRTHNNYVFTCPQLFCRIRVLHITVMQAGTMISLTFLPFTANNYANITQFLTVTIIFILILHVQKKV